MSHARVLDVQTPPRGKSWVGIGETLAELRSAHTSLGQLDSSGARNFGRKRSTLLPPPPLPLPPWAPGGSSAGLPRPRDTTWPLLLASPNV